MKNNFKNEAIIKSLPQPVSKSNPHSCMNISYISILSSTSLKICASCHKGCMPEVFDNIFQYASNIHCYNTRYTAKRNLYKISIQTNVGKQSMAFMAKNIWKDLPTHLKTQACLNFHNCIVRTTNEIN